MIHVIASYEVVKANVDGEVLLSANDQGAMLRHASGVELPARIDGADLLVAGSNPFQFELLPQEALDYLLEHRKIRFAEFGQRGDISRLATLHIT